MCLGWLCRKHGTHILYIQTHGRGESLFCSRNVLRKKYIRSISSLYVDFVLEVGIYKYILLSVDTVRVRIMLHLVFHNLNTFHTIPRITIIPRMFKTINSSRMIKLSKGKYV